MELDPSAASKKPLDRALGLKGCGAEGLNQVEGFGFGFGGKSLGL